MKERHRRSSVTFALTWTVVCLAVGIANAQIQSAGGGYYVAGYGTVYGSFGQASAAQSRMYDRVREQNRKVSERDASIKRWGVAAVEKAEREAASGAATQSNTQIVVPPAPVIRNHGVFRPDPTVDTGKALADALGGTPEEKALIRQIYFATKAEYEKEAAVRGWKNNMAGGLTFFTVAAISVYRDGDRPSDDGANAHYRVLNMALDEIPEFGTVKNRDKQGFNNVLVGFGGILLASYMEAQQNNDASALASSRKLAGMLIELVLKTDPENLRIENGQIVIK